MLAGSVNRLRRIWKCLLLYNTVKNTDLSKYGLQNYIMYFEDYDQTLMRQNVIFHDDVIKWKHFPRYWPFVRGIHRSPVNSPHKGR